VSDACDSDEGVPTGSLKQARALEALATTVATGTASPRDEKYYVALRDALRADDAVWGKLPSFVRMCRTTGQFWAFIKPKFATYQARRVFISTEFQPVFDHLERLPGPSDGAVDAALAILSSEAVTEHWQKALSRVEADPAGAITLARTLLEATLKLILERRGVEYDDSSDLNSLYRQASGQLALAPSDHEAEPIKRTLGSLANLVNGLATLRNRLSDAHGRGARVPARPSPRHARLAVNAAGALAAFLCETCLHNETAQKRP
jgi:hypothetical protein